MPTLDDTEEEYSSPQSAQPYQNGKRRWQMNFSDDDSVSSSQYSKGVFGRLRQSLPLLRTKQRSDAYGYDYQAAPSDEDEDDVVKVAPNRVPQKYRRTNMLYYSKWFLYRVPIFVLMFL
jgi:hypothetical protein